MNDEQGRKQRKRCCSRDRKYSLSFQWWQEGKGHSQERGDSTVNKCSLVEVGSLSLRTATASEA